MRVRRFAALILVSVVAAVGLLGAPVHAVTAEKTPVRIIPGPVLRAHPGGWQTTIDANTGMGPWQFGFALGTTASVVMKVTTSGPCTVTTSASPTKKHKVVGTLYRHGDLCTMTFRTVPTRTLAAADAFTYTWSIDCPSCANSTSTVGLPGRLVQLAAPVGSTPETATVVQATPGEVLCIFLPVKAGQTALVMINYAMTHWAPAGPVTGDAQGVGALPAFTALSADSMIMVETEPTQYILVKTT